MSLTSKYNAPPRNLVSEHDRTVASWNHRALDCGSRGRGTVGFQFMSLMPYHFSAHFSAETGVIGSNPKAAHSQQNVLRIGHTNYASSVRIRAFRSIDGRVVTQWIANPMRPCSAAALTKRWQSGNATDC